VSKIFTYLNEESGFSAAECALGLAVVGTVVGVSAGFLGALLMGSASFVGGVADCIRTHSHLTAC
jgi:hypothetical protein